MVSSSPKEDHLYEVVIIGGAAAGLTAAIYAARQGLRTLVVTKDIGGQALLTNDIQNYPGFTAIGGFELMNLFYQQAQTFGAEFIFDEVISITEQEAPKSFLAQGRKATYRAEALILAFGKTPRDLGVPGEQRLQGKGVSYCAVCDAPLFKGRVVAVVGHADPALDAVEMLTHHASKIYLIHETPRLAGDPELLDRVRSSGLVEVLPRTKVVEIVGEERVEGLQLQGPEGRRLLPVEGVFVELGYVAKTGFVKDFVRLNEQGEIVVDKYCATSRPGVFAAGDVTDTPYKQAVISAGQGATAALSAYNYLQRLRGRPAIRGDWKALPVKVEKGGLGSLSFKLG
jgi:thioredoxin reductase (NADPH)